MQIGAMTGPRFSNYIKPYSQPYSTLDDALVKK